MVGSSSIDMAAAVSNAGGLGMLGLGPPMGPTDGVHQTISQLHSKLEKGKPYGVNIFVPPPIGHPQSLTEHQEAAVKTWVDMYNTLMTRHGVNFKVDATSPPPLEQQWSAFDAWVEAFIEAQVPVISFHFGLPAKSTISSIKHAGLATVACATTGQEAKLIQDAGVDFVVVQGAEAGGHRGTFYNTDGGYKVGLNPTMALLQEVLAAVDIPVIAAGGIMDGAGIRQVIDAGAAGAWLGTAFLTTTEALTEPWQRTLLLSDSGPETTVTQAFTGKAARGLATEIAVAGAEVQEKLPGLFGLANVRAAAAAAKAQGAQEAAITLAGQSYRKCRAMSTAELMLALEKEADDYVAL